MGKIILGGDGGRTGLFVGTTFLSPGSIKKPVILNEAQRRRAQDVASAIPTIHIDTFTRSDITVDSRDGIYDIPDLIFTFNKTDIFYANL